MIVSELERLVVLTGGLTVPAEPLVFLLDLEARGFTIRRDGNDLLIGPAVHLTPDDRAQVKRWKSHLLSIVDYQPPEVA